jgi:hypothetical protein
MSGFTWGSDEIALPTGAWARPHRRSLRWRGRTVVAFTQGAFRPYLFPLYTPAGFAVTTESPADHPHHHSVWVAADHVHMHVAAMHGTREEYTYNFYVNEVFQGRAPGRQLELGITGAEIGPGRYRVAQAIEWRGPGEWGAPEGRVVLREERVTEVWPGERYHVIDVTSAVTAAEWDVAIGPTRHAYFNARVAESMRGTQGGVLTDARGRMGAEAITGGDAEWVDYSGPAGGGHVAGIALFRPPRHQEWWWYVAEWGVLTAGPFRQRPIRIRPGETESLAARFVVHDGDGEALPLADLYRAYVEDGPTASAPAPVPS